MINSRFQFFGADHRAQVSFLVNPVLLYIPAVRFLRIKCG